MPAPDRARPRAPPHRPRADERPPRAAGPAAGSPSPPPGQNAGGAPLRRTPGGGPGRGKALAPGGTEGGRSADQAQARRRAGPTVISAWPLATSRRTVMVPGARAMIVPDATVAPPSGPAGVLRPNRSTSTRCPILVLMFGPRLKRLRPPCSRQAAARTLGGD